MAVLSASGVSCVKSTRTLFSGLDFTLGASEILHVTGPNGAGKTSLLRLLVGLSVPEQGEIRFRDTLIAQCRDTFAADLIYFGHKPGLSLHLSGVENLLFWCKLNGCQSSESAVMAILSELGLVGLEDIPVSQLSAGQQRRVALARLWLKSQASLWVLDEPFTALDVSGIALLRAKMAAHLKASGSIILTSHQTLEIDYPVKTLALEYQI